MLDASGHGVAAALRAVALMTFLREDNLAKAVGSLDPGAIITEANRLFPLTQDGEYFTLWVGRLDISSRMLSYATAGHSGALLQAVGNGSRWLSMASLPLGFDPHSVFESMHTPLLSLDRLYLLSDGIYEAPSPTGELWGRDRLQATLEAHRSHSWRCWKTPRLKKRGCDGGSSGHGSFRSVGSFGRGSGSLSHPGRTLRRTLGTGT
ncbi:MAG: hypothetical protein DYH03_01965 [Nitrospira sp. NTP1]|nr:hypothetical protein [Nitrospira sp. NTP1]